MQKTPTMKLFVVLLAALALISAVLVHNEFRAAKQTQQEKVAAALAREHEQMRQDDADYREQHKREIEEQEQFKKQVEALKKKVHAYAGNESKTLTTNP